MSNLSEEEKKAIEIEFSKRLQREKQKIDKYNRGRFDTIEEILELLEENNEESDTL